MFEKDDDLFRELTSGVHCRSAVIDTRGDLVEQPDDVQKLFKSRVGLRDMQDVYIFGLTPSTQALDAYGTRMSADAMSQYVQDAMGGTPLMNSHKTGGWFSDTELALGYSFHGEIRGEPIDESPLLPTKRKTQRDLDKQGLSLFAYDYMLRDHWPNGRQEVGTNDIIQSIEGRVLRSVSIGFSHKLPDRMVYVCGLCGRPMGRGLWSDEEDACRHVPLVRDKDSGFVAFAWVRGSKMYEHSAVWAGATPGAVIEQARAVARLGDLSGSELDLLEDLWKVRIRPRSRIEEVVSMTEPVLDEVVSEEEVSEETAAPELVVTEEETEQVGDERIVSLELGFGNLQDEVLRGQTEVGARINDLADTVAALGNVVTSVAETVEELTRRFDADQEVRDEVLSDLIEEAVQAKVRALGPETDTDRYRELLKSMSIEEIRAEIAEHERAVTSLFNAGRVVVNADEKGRLPRQGLRKEDVSLYKIG